MKVHTALIKQNVIIDFRETTRNIISHNCSTRIRIWRYKHGIKIKLSHLYWGTQLENVRAVKLQIFTNTQIDGDDDKQDLLYKDEDRQLSKRRE